MAEFIQQQFLGASVRGFNAHMGWGSSPSTLSVELVADPVLNEVFNPVAPGQPVLFNYNSWRFGGILQSWKKNRSESGNPTYSVEVIDPREILNGVQLIIDSYVGPVYRVPNVYNIFGYAESVLGFGGAGVNEGGMPWTLIRDGFNSLQTTNPVNLSGNPLYVNLANLPNLPPFHRIPGPSISVMDYVSDICEAAGHDFFFNLSFVGSTSHLTLYTISRKNTPRIGAINSFISSLDEFTTSDVGLEFRNEVTNRFLIGGKVQKLFVQEINEGEELLNIEANDRIYPPEADDTIAPYFGIKEDNTGVKFLNGFAHYNCLYDDQAWRRSAFEDGRVQNTFGLAKIKFEHPTITQHMIGRPEHVWWTDGKYITNLQELRAALAGQDMWENFLFLHNSLRSPQNPQGKKIFFTPLQNPLVDQPFEVNNIHHGKYAQTGLDLLGLFNSNLQAKIQQGTAQDFTDFLDNDFSMSYLLENKSKNADINKVFDAEQRRQKLYDVIYQFASTYFGRKYMVAVPFVVGKINQDEDQVVVDWRGNEQVVPGNKIVTSLEPTDGGYIDNVDYQVTDGAGGSTYEAVENSEFAIMIEEEILPLDISKFQTNDGKIGAIARFRKAMPSGEPIDISNLSDSDYVEYNGYYYVKCEVEPNLVFADNATLFSPRAVVTLPGFVTTVNDNLRWQAQLIKEYIKVAAGNRYTQNQVQNDRILNRKLGNGVSTDLLNDNGVGFPVAPSMIIVPLKSNIYTYGPWYAIGGNGKSEIEVDEELVPWRYGSYNLMNLSAQARIQESATTQQYSETGNVTFAGAPVVRLGELLIAGGPYLTDVNVQIGSDGATTTYSFSTWTKKFGTIPKELLDQQRKTGTLLKRQRAALFNQAANNTIVGQQVKAIDLKPKKAPRRVESSSTHAYLVSEKVGQKNIIAVAPSYNAADQTADPTDKALTTFDTIFCPFSTKIFSTDDERNAASISHLEYPSGVTGYFNATGLNPFVYPHPFNSIMRDDDEWDESFVVENSGQDDTDGYRTLGLRMPAIFVGWGVDTNNKPVPASPDDPNEFADDYRTNVTKWKAGPLLTKWNNRLKGWEASGSALKRCQVLSNLPFNGSGLSTIYEYIQASGKNIAINSEYMHDWLLGSGMFIPAGTKCIFYTEGDRNYIVNAACVVSNIPITY